MLVFVTARMPPAPATIFGSEGSIAPEPERRLNGERAARRRSEQHEVGDAQVDEEAHDVDERRDERRGADR
ncbi:MAG TPA: hypothetical protein VIL20_13445, partial [Sandaracinaceae bacterium]